MNKRIPKGPARNEIEIPGQMAPILSVLAFLPMMAIILIILAIAVEDPQPVPLLVLLVFVIGSCAWLSFTALQYMIGGKVTFDDQGLTVHRFLAETTYPWSSLEACKVIPATGTFGDNGMVEVDDRAGVGLFVRGSDRQRQHDLDADVIICAGVKDHLQPLIRIASKIDGAIKRAREGAGRGPAPRGQRPPQNPARRPAQKRRPANGSSAAADPVAQFRNRAR